MLTHYFWHIILFYKCKGCKPSSLTSSLSSISPKSGLDMDHWFRQSSNIITLRTVLRICWSISGCSSNTCRNTSLFTTTFLLDFLPAIRTSPIMLNSSLLKLNFVVFYGPDDLRTRLVRFWWLKGVFSLQWLNQSTLLFLSKYLSNQSDLTAAHTWKYCHCTRITHWS